jgi:hypothetical protein
VTVFFDVTVMVPVAFVFHNLQPMEYDVLNVPDAAGVPPTVLEAKLPSSSVVNLKTPMPVKRSCGW